MSQNGDVDIQVDIDDGAPSDDSARVAEAGSRDSDGGPELLPQVRDLSLTSGVQPAVTRVGRYDLVFELASGGMATVYAARAQGAHGFEKLVALKRIHPHLANERGFVEMFLDEARIASRIHHANVCTVNDFGEADGSYYIAMEFLIGEALSRVLKVIHQDVQRRADPRNALFISRILAEACEGLHAAHELRSANGQMLNVVHRDISPQNLFVTYEGNTKVVDFGIASASDRVHHTDTGQVKGKFSYMAPEQVQGFPLDRRADVWALGVVLWEGLAMRRLFRRKTPAETLVALLNERIPAPSEYRATIPPELDAIVLKALSRDVDARYQTARDLGRDLNRYLSKSGESVGLAELSDWMDELFPNGKQKLAEHLERASQGKQANHRPPRIEQSESSSLSAMGMGSRDSLRPPTGRNKIARRTPPGGVSAGEAGDFSDASPAGQTPAPVSATSRMSGAHVVPAFSQNKQMLTFAAIGLACAAIGVGGALFALRNRTDPNESPITTAQPVPNVGSGTPAPVAGQPVAVPAQLPPRQVTAIETSPSPNTQTSDGRAEQRPTKTGRVRPGRGGSRTGSEAAGSTVTAAPTEPNRAEATGDGTLIIESPGAGAFWQVIISGNGVHRVERTPINTSLPPGTYTLKMRPNGQIVGIVTETRVVRSGRETRVSRALD